MKSVDLHAVELQRDQGDPAGYAVTYCRLGPLIGADKLGATLYELEPGNASCPYHYELGNEEWLLVLTGTVTVRHPGGSDQVGPGGVVCFPEGPGGAHKVSNLGEGPARFLVFSTLIRPAAFGYPDSGKIGLSAGDDWLLFRRSSSVDYWDGEV